MEQAWLDGTLDWIAQHSVWAGALIFAIAFLDSLLILGVAVPALPLLFGVGTLIGMGHIDGPYAITCAAAGAFLGDGVSFWVGRRWGPQLRVMWPFSRYPQLLNRGEVLFRRHDAKSILIARFVGAIRPFVPAIAGMLGMPIKRYALASAFAAVTWAAVFLVPGWAFGASYNAVAAVADRLVLVLGGMLLLLALVWACVLYIWRWFDRHANSLLTSALAWSRAHPHLSRYAMPLIDPSRPESASLAILAVGLLVIGCTVFGLLTTLLVNDGLSFDRSVHAFMLTLRNPLADRLLAGLASMGDAVVLTPAASLTMLWLLWRRRWMAAGHWAAALAFGLVLTVALEALIDMPKPPGAHEGFGFPSVAVTMATITFGFFAVLIARELPGRSRVWPYSVAAAVVALLGFARIYFGMHWLSDVVGGTLLGVFWLLALGIAYRRHARRSFWMKPLALIFYASFAVAAIWHAPRAIDPLLRSIAPPPRTLELRAEQWWRDGWRQLPAQRDAIDPKLRWPLNVQILGALLPLEKKLQAQGWQVQPQADWVATLSLLDKSASVADQPILPATLDTEAEVLLLRRPVSPQQLQVLRIWRAPAKQIPGEELWIGSVQTLNLIRPLSMFALWQPQAGELSAWHQLRADLAAMDVRVERHPGQTREVILLRTDP
ncbi:MAG: VTT domain-containing protein [Pseudomarimonas sp.]